MAACFGSSTRLLQADLNPFFCDAFCGMARLNQHRYEARMKCVKACQIAAIFSARIVGYLRAEGCKMG